jgi:hypothetical protein
MMLKGSEESNVFLGQAGHPGILATPNFGAIWTF